MVDLFSARRLEQEVDTMVSAAIHAGLKGQVKAAINGQERSFVVDRIVSGDAGTCSEVWLSASVPSNFFQRIMDSFRGVQRRDLIRIVREEGDIRRTVTRIEIDHRGITHIGFREEICAPRLSRSVATFSYPRGDATDWLFTYRKAS